MSDHTYVFLHGSPGNASNWVPLIELAPPGVHAQAWDLLDHGARDAPHATLEDTVLDVVERVRALGGPVTLVGHSFGVWVAGRALAMLGDQVERFVAIAGIARLPPEIAERSAGFAAALTAGQLSLAAGTQAACGIWLTAHDPDPSHVERIRALIEADTVERLARVLGRQPGLADAVRQVAPFDTPAVILHCKEDRGVPIAFGRDLAALGSRAEMVELDGDDHFVHWAHPELVARHVFG